MVVLGLDTSNYTTSVAVFDGTTGENVSRLLEVPSGSLGLRQSDALFQHVKRLPQLTELLAQKGLLNEIAAVGAATRPRTAPDSYMPCFLAGESVGQAISHTLGVPFYSWSHQQGHLAAAAWSAGRPELLDSPFLAWHLSGGTTELLLAQPTGEEGLTVKLIGGTEDLSAGQLIDRAGKLLGLDFPAGKALDELSAAHDTSDYFKVKLRGLDFSLSGVENQVAARYVKTGDRADTARFALLSIAHTVEQVTRQAKALYGDLPVLFSGGVASNSLLRDTVTEGIFAQPQYSTDNAMGVAVLTWLAGQRR